MLKLKQAAAALAVVGLASPAWGASFVNGGFENGDLTGWTQGGGTWSLGTQGNAPVSPSAFAGGTPTNTVMSGGTDPLTNANTVYGGNHSVRVNDVVNNRSVSTISQSVTAYTDNNIFFAWNAVLEGSHGLTDSDYFSLTLVDDTTSTTIVNRAYSSAGAIGGGTTGVTWTAAANNSSWLTSGWVVESIDLVALNAVGHDFTLTLLASDCPYGAHAGYVYLDGFGSAAPDPGNGVPIPGGLALLGAGALALGFARRKA
ncbi:MAG: hypothetical protein LT102_11120 [Burkholderiaceae bacterium]|nr:hypothetical protein [Burkholderiaceae bacterium]